jgi:hypothetical protein
MENNDNLESGVVAPQVGSQLSPEVQNTLREQKEALKELDETITKAIDDDFIEEITQSNVNEFTYDNVKYRVNKPSYQQKQDIYKEKVTKFTALLKDKAYSLEKTLKADYLSRGIDIEAMTKKIHSLDKTKRDLQIKLGEALKNNASDNDCEALKKEIIAIEMEQRDIAMDKYSLLEYSIENQVTLHLYNYMTYIIAEKQVADKWVKITPTFDEFLKLDENLLGKLAFLVSVTYPVNA